MRDEDETALDLNRLDEILSDRSLSLHTQRRLIAELRSAREASERSFVTVGDLIGNVVQTTLRTDRKLTEKQARLIRDAVHEAGGDITQLQAIARKFRLELVLLPGVKIVGLVLALALVLGAEVVVAVKG